MSDDTQIPYPRASLVAYARHVAVQRGIPLAPFLGQIQHESRFNPYARGPTDDVGISQFRPKTAKQYELIDDDGTDHRTDPFRSLEAHGKYISDLHKQTGNWHDAFAAFNTGVEGLKRSPEKGEKYVQYVLAQARKFGNHGLTEIQKDVTPPPPLGPPPRSGEEMARASQGAPEVQEAGTRLGPPPGGEAPPQVQEAGTPQGPPAGGEAPPQVQEADTPHVGDITGLSEDGLPMVHMPDGPTEVHPDGLTDEQNAKYQAMCNGGISGMADGGKTNSDDVPITSPGQPTVQPEFGMDLSDPPYAGLDLSDHTPATQYPGLDLSDSGDEPATQYPGMDLSDSATGTFQPWSPDEKGRAFGMDLRSEDEKAAQADAHHTTAGRDISAPPPGGQNVGNASGDPASDFPSANGRSAANPDPFNLHPEWAPPSDELPLPRSGEAQYNAEHPDRSAWQEQVPGLAEDPEVNSPPGLGARIGSAVAGMIPTAPGEALDRFSNKWLGNGNRSTEGWGIPAGQSTDPRLGADENFKGPVVGEPATGAPPMVSPKNGEGDWSQYQPSREQRAGEQMDQGFREQRAGLNADTAVARKLGAGREGIARQGEAMYTQQLMKQQDLIQRMGAESNKRMNDYQQMVDRFAHMRVDPSSYWNNKDTGHQALGYLGILVSGLSGSEHNMAMEGIQKSIDRDIDAQKSNIGNAQHAAAGYHNLYEMNMSALKDESAARAASSAMIKDQLAAQGSAMEASLLGSAAGATNMTKLGALRQSSAMDKAKVQTAVSDAVMKQYGATGTAQDFAQNQHYRDALTTMLGNPQPVPSSGGRFVRQGNQFFDTTKGAAPTATALSPEQKSALIMKTPPENQIETPEGTVYTRMAPTTKQREQLPALNASRQTLNRLTQAAETGLRGRLDPRIIGQVQADMMAFQSGYGQAMGSEFTLSSRTQKTWDRAMKDPSSLSPADWAEVRSNLDTFDHQMRDKHNDILASLHPILTMHQ